MEERYQMIDVDKIAYDYENPRIKEALEKYKGITDERIQFALSSATEGTTGTSSYSALKDSIRASNGVMTAITVIPSDGGYKCIDGNTRLAIYKEFIKENAKGDWQKIKAVVLENTEQREIERTRIAAHLVGARDWPAYEKARYLNDLRENHYLDYDEMIAICGGKKADIERQINAYHDMNEYYRDVVEDTTFHLDRFSGFVELQKPKIKDAIFQAGLELKDFGKWIRDGNIYRLMDVRHLPRVLGDDQAREKFLTGGPKSIEEAVKFLDLKTESALSSESGKADLQKASLYQLATMLTRRINDMSYADLKSLKDKGHGDAIEQVRVLETLSENLQELLADVSE